MTLHDELDDVRRALAELNRALRPLRERPASRRLVHRLDGDLRRMQEDVDDLAAEEHTAGDGLVPPARDFAPIPVPPREALIVAALFAHPETLHHHADMLATMDLVSGETRNLADILLDCALHETTCEVATLEARVERSGLAASLARLRGRVSPGDRWMLVAGADSLRLDDALRQAFTLQRRARTLNSELKAAERALAEDGSDANLVWLREVQAELSSLDGAEADPDAA